MKLKTLILSLCSASTLAFAAHAETITIATVNNGDMIRMQKLTDDFAAKNPGIELNWVTLEENVLRERVTTDIATKGGQYDIVTIGNYEVPIWAKEGWLLELTALGDNFDVDDLLPAIRGGLSLGRAGARAALRPRQRHDPPGHPAHLPRRRHPACRARRAPGAGRVLPAVERNPA